MRRHNLALWCCTFLLVASSELRENFTTTIDNAWNNSTVRYEIHDDTITTNRSNGAELIRYDVREKSTKNNDHVQFEFRANSTSNNREDNNSMQNEFRIHSTRKDHEGGNQMPIELRANSTEVDDKNNFTSHKLHGNSTQIEDRSNLTYKTEKFYADNNEKNAISCEDTVCIPLCCPYGSRMMREKCKAAKSGNYIFPDVYEYATNNSLERKPIGQKLDELFQLIIYNPCLPHQDRYVLEPKTFSQDDYMFLINGSLYRPPGGTFVESYCLALLKQDTYQVAICFNDDDETVLEEQDEYQQNLYPVGLVVSLPFLLATFVVYSILPELRNMHGYTLRAYVGSMFIAYTSLAIIQLSHPDTIPDSGCIALAFIIHFSFLASFFWLNVMCFDIWWTFGGFRSLQGSMKQRERKKFVMYSIYAWGSASLLSIICAIMDFVPNVPQELIRPEFGETKCWFNTNEARALYFYGPMGVTVFCNICLFISTALKIVRHKKDTAHHLRGSESRRHDDNKQWFNLYLKLFIVMGINWSMEIISWLFPKAPAYVWYLSDLTNTLQGLIIFIIFVWKEKIKRLLLKRFGCQDRSLFSRNSTHSGCHSSASRTCTTTSGVMSLQEKVNPYVQTNCRAKSSSDEADP